MNEFSQYLKELRGKRSLREMEKITGLSHTYLSTLEKGYDPRSGKKRQPSPETLKKLSETLDIPYTELMKAAGYIEDSSEYTLEDLQKLLEEFSWLDFESFADSSYPGRKFPIANPSKSYKLLEELPPIVLKFFAEIKRKNMPFNEILLSEEEMKIGVSIESLLKLDNLSYKGNTLSENDKQKILTKIAELENEFEYQK